MTAHADELIDVAHAGAVATITLNRPAKRNAMSYVMWARLEHAAIELGADPGTRIVVLRGAGDHFCAGADITELNVTRGPGERSFSEVNMAAESALADLPKPTVAFIRGDCIGGGCALAIDCDLRVATPEARFGITPAKLGIVYPSASLERVTHLLGPAVTKRLLFSGELIDSAEAFRVGLVDEIVDVEAAEERLATLADVLAARSLLTQAATKSMVTAVLRDGRVPDELRQVWATEAATAPDLAEGIAAFVEKRAPRFRWTGRHDGEAG